MAFNILRKGNAVINIDLGGRGIATPRINFQSAQLLILQVRPHILQSSHLINEGLILMLTTESRNN